ncbi:Stk1 family PASTA domain-containing Ser/Thr kinase [Pseudonocardia nigra]|uniref:Stk1 family PASTA domain-containing Ser/Thr kinase n=1 Tax=Pseudonocardia nigra TaxID=1921578 RepID=UPI001C5D9710|nr:Stk1 family PASTA domain-containing Ser/Thr kinase [Pseudonocardia nigra]
MTTPRLLSERYELGEVLGYGGMSEVHRGLDTRLGRDVAIKVLRADLARDPQFQMRFRREAQNAAALNHPAIVAVYDTGEVQSEFGPLPYIVMEYVDGQTLREIVKTTGPMTQQKVIEVMADVCAALDFSHRHNIIHRDVKPANVMINRSGAVKVMDFGIARALGEGQNVTQTAAVIGTAQYLSPEQARGEAVDARSDVYAAGCVLFELLTGEPPFTGDTPVAVAYQHVREDPRRPSEVNPSVPATLDAVVLKALSKNPVNRYQSAAEMRSDLVRVRSGQNPMAPLVMSEDERTAMLAPPRSTGPTRRLNGSRHTAAAPVPDYDYYDDEPPRNSTGKTIGIAAAVLIALGLVGFVAFQLLRGSPPPAMVAVPNVVGQSETDARNQIIAADLVVREVRPVESEVGEVGQVLSTEPPVGQSVQEGSAVALLVGEGPATAAVPPLEGRTVEEAGRLLQERGLTLGEQTTRETSDSDMVGRVLESTPRAGEEVEGGSAVAVVVGTEPTTVAVPDVSGLDQNAAQQRLGQAGFTVQVQQVSGPGEEGAVVGTNPVAGTQVQRGSQVTLQVSSGDQIEIPDVIGLEPQDAVEELQEAGFQRVGRESRPTTNESEDNRVIGLSTGDATTASPDEQIIVYFGRYPGGIFDN